MQGPPLPRPVYPPDAAGYPVSEDGPDVVAFKRALWRGGRHEGPASAFDDTYSNAFAHGKGDNVVQTGVAGFQRQMRIEDTGYIGTRTYNALRSALIPPGLPNAGQPLFDAIAVDLLEQAFHRFREPSGADKIEEIRRVMQDYMRRSIVNARDWHYRQQRPMRSLGDDPSRTIYSDCSEGATAIYFWAARQTGYEVPDPNGPEYDYNGYGNTDSLLAHNPRVGVPYQVGDLALYGAHGGHVTVCMRPGFSPDSRWWSNGSEGGPYEENLWYRSDLVAVVRPRQLA